MALASVVVAVPAWAQYPTPVHNIETYTMGVLPNGFVSGSSSAPLSLSQGTAPSSAANGIWSYDGNYVSALVAPANQTLRAVAAAGNPKDDQRFSQVFARSDYQLSLLAPGPGQNLGDPAQFQISLRLDGELASGFKSLWPALILPSELNVVSSAQMSFRYLVANFGQPGSPYYGGEGYGLLDLNAEASAQYLQQFLPIEQDSQGNWIFAHRETRGWNYTVWDQNTGQNLMQGSDGSSGLHGWGLGYETLSFDTGTLTFTFNAQVGDVIGYSGVLMTAAWTQGNVGMHALADFSKTFDAEITSLTPGVTIAGITPGVAAAVPEPASWLLWLAALPLLLWQRRRQMREPA